MVSALLVVLFLAAFQVGFALYVRNNLTAFAAEGARYGARADSSPAQGAERARSLISAGLSGRYASNVSADQVSENGARVVRVTVRAPIPVIGPFGPQGALTVTGRAYAEGQG
ncbi:pilus assembly protein [Calidifontibacter sp. DB0510]|uniref:Pilus assembly protein n=2 Tax=Metallococcus carri TaxID=1656884 RepID=A0A967B0C2_9MICO|nr:pilus assembly protein [Metallococcus carri]NOP36075.1 pilus assembly protein [Calidifontibacter sp. DB2511S]